MSEKVENKGAKHGFLRALVTGTTAAVAAAFMAGCALPIRPDIRSETGGGQNPRNVVTVNQGGAGVYRGNPNGSHGGATIDANGNVCPHYGPNWASRIGICANIGDIVRIFGGDQPAQQPQQLAPQQSTTPAPSQQKQLKF